MARTRSKSPGRKKKSPTKSKSKSKSSKAVSRKTSLICTTDQALILNIVAQGVYCAIFFGARGDASDVFWGAGATSGMGPLCKTMPQWMGLANFMFVLNDFMHLRNGSEKEKKGLLFVRATHWLVYFCMIVAKGRASYGGMQVDSEYFMGVAVTFIMGFVSRHGSEGHKTWSSVYDYGTRKGRAFLIMCFFVLFNTFNVGVMGGEQYFTGEAMGPACQANVGFFASFIFLYLWDIMSMMQNSSASMQKDFFRNGMLIQLAFIGLNYVNRDTMDHDFLMVNYGVCAIQLLVAYWGWKA